MRGASGVWDGSLIAADEGGLVPHPANQLADVLAKRVAVAESGMFSVRMDRVQSTFSWLPFSAGTVGYSK